MKYTVVGKNIEVTKGIRDHIEKKLSKMDKYFKHAEEIECRALVRSYKSGAKVEITIYSPNVTFRSEVTHQDLYAAVDLSVDKLEGQMRKFKTQISRKRDKKTNLGQALALERIEVEKADEESREVVKTKSLLLEPMTLDDAVARMEAIGHAFFIYLDEEDNKIAVLYKREEGGYGLIEAENGVK